MRPRRGLGLGAPRGSAAIGDALASCFRGNAPPMPVAALWLLLLDSSLGRGAPARRLPVPAPVRVAALRRAQPEQAGAQAGETFVFE